MKTTITPTKIKLMNAARIARITQAKLTKLQTKGVK